MTVVNTSNARWVVHRCSLRASRPCSPPTRPVPVAGLVRQPAKNACQPRIAYGQRCVCVCSQSLRRLPLTHGQHAEPCVPAPSSCATAAAMAKAGKKAIRIALACQHHFARCQDIRSYCANRPDTRQASGVACHCSERYIQICEAVPNPSESCKAFSPSEVPSKQADNCTRLPRRVKNTEPREHKAPSKEDILPFTQWSWPMEKVHLLLTDPYA